MFNLGVKKSFGIDIGTQTIKIVEITDGNGKLSIDNYSIWGNDISNVIQQKNSETSLSPQDITKIIKLMLQKSGMSLSEAYVALPSYMALFAVTQVPMLDEKELLTALPLEAKKHIPVPLNSVQLDWINLGKNNLKDKYNILIIAVPNSVADKYIEITKTLGIKIKGFELDCFSTLRTLNLTNEATCIIDIGARNSTAMIVNNKQLQTIQSFDFGGNYITEAIAQLKGCSALEAENLKKQNGLTGSSSQITDIIKSKIDNFFSNDVSRLLKIVNDDLAIKIDNIVVLGGMSQMNGIMEYLKFIFKNQFNNENIKIYKATSAKTVSVKGISDLDIATSIWQDLILSVGVALKNYIE